MAEITIYSAVVCPFAHRSRLVLLEKGIDFDLVEIDLQNKPANFTDISPYSKVPVIKHGNERVWESAIINEYLDEVFPQPSLLPKDAISKAQARIWIDFANTRFVPAFSSLLRSLDSQKQKEAAQELEQHLRFIENEALAKLSDNGPYWFGEAISLVDLTFYPWFERWAAIEQYRGFKLPAELTRIQKWWDAVSQRESVKAIANSPKFYLERYARFAPLPFKKVSEELSSAGQITPEQLQQAAKQGFQSVLNLRSPDEQGFFNDEQQHAQAAGLNYANIPINPAQANQELVEKAIWEIDNLPKPILVHCAAGARATAIALIANASQQQLTPEEIKLKAQELGLNLDQPHLKQFLQQN
ncbi:glutathione S-transferase N-terminal domain-containing protein [Calothrix sp. NIES-2098]|uniref:glutathione S-transferase N-terminal domain-containing protein n=1 Tax=Calothrix sp. NIES-2098 TaxID=1954171 RepID=UPI000B602030|nr:glutathione S-transferase-like protein [Calothrix sp. NIES-2098]